MDRTSIKQIIQDIVNLETPTVVTGMVIDMDPLCITLVNNLQVKLSAVSLVIPKRLFPLEIGEQFYMLSFNNNKSYYLLDRA